MEKLVKPEMPIAPEGIDWPLQPKEYIDTVVYQTETTIDKDIRKIKAKQPDISREDLCAKLNKKYPAHIDSEGLICVDQDDKFISYAHDMIPDDKVSLSDILSTISKEDIPYVYIRGISCYKGDYIYGNPGVEVFIRKKDPDYASKVIAFKKYRQDMLAYYDQVSLYEAELAKREEIKQCKIAAKIKEMEENGEI